MLRPFELLLVNNSVIWVWQMETLAVKMANNMPPVSINNTHILQFHATRHSNSLSLILHEIVSEKYDSVRIQLEKRPKIPSCDYRY